MQRFNRVIVLAIFLASANPFSRSVSAQDDLSADRVRESIKRGVNYLKNSQQDGRWPKYRLYTGGTTALATLALLNAGVPESDPVLQRSIRVVLNLPREKTYVVSLRVMALAIADPQGKKYKTDIARDIERLADATKSGKVALEDLRGSTFTITSLGAQGGLFATPILNTPEVGILGIHRIKERPVVRDGEIVIGHVMLLSLSFDHRLIDGHVGAAFAYELISYIENPDRLMLEMA